MRVLITGNMGYVGPVLAQFLKRIDKSIELIGYDSCYFGHCLTGTSSLPEHLYTKQYFGDIRQLPENILVDIDSIIHLSAVSNDPMGKEFEVATEQINRQASVRLAKLAAKIGVKNFVFASSCSMYGASEGGARRETDPTNPLTAYAKSKIGTEQDLITDDLGGMIFTSLRFATACGMSDRLRLDLVLNDFVACAVTSKEITILSDGTPWRPLIDVEDMARIISWAFKRNADNGGKYLAVNAGRNESNYQVKDVADTVARLIPGTKVTINPNAPPDKRSYQVDFSLLKSLAPEYLPQISLQQSVQNLIMGMERMTFNEVDFRNSLFMRLNVLRKHMADGRIGADLYWK